MIDANGCNVIVDFTVSAADSVIIYASEYFDACGNDSSGIFLQPSGSWPFTYQWSTGIRRHMYGVLRLDWYRLP